MPIPQNAKEIYDFLRSHGYSGNAAAGIVGNIAQESGGNPEAGGPGNAGIIQWTPESKAFPVRNILTGRPRIDLRNQLRDVLAYNQAQGAAAMRRLNSASSPSAAALIYSRDFERPAAWAANNPNREASAEEVARAARTGNWKSTTTGSLGAGADGGGGGGGGQQAQLTSFLEGGSGGVLADAGALLHGSAVVLDRVFGLFAPGNGWRIVFTGVTGLAGLGAYKAYTAGGEDGGAELPLAIALTGVGLVAAFMAFRPWPQTGGGPIKPGAYVVDVLRGEPPPAGPGTFTATEVHLTEAGLATLLALWAAGKAAGAASALGSAAAAGGGVLGKIWGWIRKGAGEVEQGAGEFGAAAGEAV